MPRKGLAVAVMVAFLLSLFLGGCALFRKPEPRQPGNVQEKHRDAEPQSGSETVVLGFYTEKGPGEETDSSDSLRTGVELMDEVAFFWYTFDKKGNVKVWGKPNLDALEFAKEKKLKTYALIHNLGSQGFDSDLAHAVLADRDGVRSRFIENIVKTVKEGGFDGVSVDIEAVPSQDRQEYTAFLKELRAAMKGKSIQISVPAKTWDDPANEWSGAFDYAQVHKHVDQVVLMTYDENGFGTTAGPIASIPWVRNVLKYATAQMPKEKLLMGIPVYSFDWSSAAPNIPEYLTHSQVMDRAKRFNANVVFDTRAKVPRFTYKDNNGNVHEVFFEDSRSASAKIDLMKEFGLKGIAIWRLGMEDPKTWDVIKTKVKGGK